MTNTLSERTHSYWAMSSQWNTRIDSVTSVGDAIDECMSIVQQTRPEHSLKTRVAILLDTIVQGETGNVEGVEEYLAPILSFERPLKKVRKNRSVQAQAQA